MVVDLILSIALAASGQQGADFVGPPSPPKAPAAKQGSSSRREQEMKRTIEKRKAFRSARTRAGKLRESMEAEAAYQAQLKAEKDFKAALPYLVQAERARLERMSAMERNAALQRMATADERIARAIEFKSGVPQYPPYGNMPAVPRPVNNSDLGGVPLP